MKRVRVTLRDLFWLVLVSAVAAGWWVDQSQLRGREQDLERRENRLNHTEKAFWVGIARRQQDEQRLEELRRKLEIGDLYTVCPRCESEWIEKREQ